MARILGIDLPANKRIIIALTRIYGIGRNISKAILVNTGIDFDKKVKDLSTEEINKIRIECEKIQIEGELRREVGLNIKRLMTIACYRGLRHRKKLPVRGQRTRCNARTRKGRKKTVANKKKTSAKT